MRVVDIYYHSAAKPVYYYCKIFILYISSKPNAFYSLTHSSPYLFRIYAQQKPMQSLSTALLPMAE